MNKTTPSSLYELKFEAISAKLQNDSNELMYRKRILKYAKLLIQHYGGDVDIVCALVFLHKVRVRFFEFDLSDRDNEEIDKPFFDILTAIEFPQYKGAIVIQWLSERNRINLLSKYVEYQILNDAVLLASLGAFGIARFFMNSQYEDLTFVEFSRLDELFKERYRKLIFPQSISLAAKENRFTYLFSVLLQQEPYLDSVLPGKYIILEGNSGTGKDKQAELLKIFFEHKGKEVTIVKEPSEIYRDFETYFETTAKVDLTDSAPIFRLYSIIGDRYNQIHERVTQELKQGRVVISVRSYISMLVYQCENEIERLFVNFVHRFVPRPDIAIIYDANEEICLQRAILRGTKMTRFDKLENLKRFRPAYLDIAKSYLFDYPVEIVDASGTIEQVAEKTIMAIDMYL